MAASSQTKKRRPVSGSPLGSFQKTLLVAFAFGLLGVLLGLPVGFVLVLRSFLGGFGNHGRSFVASGNGLTVVVRHADETTVFYFSFKFTSHDVFRLSLELEAPEALSAPGAPSSLTHDANRHLGTDRFGAVKNI